MHTISLAVMAVTVIVIALLITPPAAGTGIVQFSIAPDPIRGAAMQWPVASRIQWPATGHLRLNRSG